MERSSFLCQKRETPPTEVVSLKNVFLHVTRACNLHCSYCYFSASKPLPNEMTTEEYMRLWPDLVTVHPQKVIFTGGEPLLRPDILDLLRSLREVDLDQHILRCLNTNGHLVTRQLARQLVGLADEVRVSVDALPERNDTMRGTGNFDAAMRALECYSSAGFAPKALVTVTSVSLPDLSELLCLLIEKGITNINVNVFRPIGRGRGHWEWSVNPEEVQAALIRGWEQLFPGIPSQTDPRELEPQTTCGVGSFLNIMPNGDVFPCHVLTDREFRCGNLREQSLLAICHRSGLLGKLAGLNFQDLASQDEHVSELIQPDACMGNVYAKTKSSAVWGKNLPMLVQGPTDAKPQAGKTQLPESAPPCTHCG